MARISAYYYSRQASPKTYTQGKQWILPTSDTGPTAEWAVYDNS